MSLSFQVFSAINPIIVLRSSDHSHLIICSPENLVQGIWKFIGKIYPSTTLGPKIIENIFLLANENNGHG